MKVGDHVAVDDSLWCWSQTRQTVEVPAAPAGIVKNILVQQGDEVTEVSQLIELEVGISKETRGMTCSRLDAPKAEAKPVEAEQKNSQQLLYSDSKDCGCKSSRYWRGKGWLRKCLSKWVIRLNLNRALWWLSLPRWKCQQLLVSLRQSRSRRATVSRRAWYS